MSHSLGQATTHDALKADACILLRQVEDLLASVQSRQVFEQHENERIFVLAHCARMGRFAQGVRVLVEAGIVDAAGALLRTVLEQGYVLGAVTDNPTLLQELTRQQHTESSKAFKGLLSIPPELRPAEASDERIAAALSGLTTGSGYNVHFWATKAGMLHSYHTQWRLLSSSAHGSGGATADYLEMDAGGDVLALRRSVADVSASDYLVATAGLLLDAVEAACEGNFNNEEAGTYAALQTKLREFSGRVGG